MIHLVGLLARQAPWQLGLAMLTSIIGGLATTAVLVVVFAALHGPRDPATVWLFAGLVLAAVGGRGASRLLVAAVTRVAVFRIRQSLAEAIVDTSLADVERLGGTRLRGTMTNDAGRLGTTLPVIVNVLSSLSFLAGCLGYLAWLQLGQLAELMGIILIGSLFYCTLHRHIRHYAGVGRQVWDEIVGSCSQLVGGIKQIKANALRRDHVLSQLEQQSRRAMHAWAMHATLSNIAIMSTQFLFYAALGTVIFAPESLAMNQEGVLRFGLAIVYMAGPLREVVTALPELAEAEVAQARIKTVGLDLRRARQRAMLDQALRLPDAPDTWSQIELTEVSHRYGPADAAKFTLQPVSLVVRRGEVLFIVGGNGTGKTTLAKVLTGLYEPTHGVVLVDGIPIDAFNRDWYAHQFSSIFSDFVLFDRPCLIASTTAQQRAEALLLRLEMNSKVGIENLRLSRITGLSSGERKRLALLTAFMEDRPGILFDEWAADQDPRFKDLFYRQLLPELKAAGKAVVVISHDDRYFDLADTIIHIERGLPPRVQRRVAAGEAA